ncbi:hypothetical protein BMS3Abin03_01715 [bacterium BMS3Abin03]|nr:hypothetical protein BMS3Abin03_01715 [bacterium BMS3Abin03]
MVKNGLVFRKNPLYEKCPSCNAVGLLRKSRARSTKEKIIKILTPYGMYRCKKCGWRGYRTKFILTKQSVKNSIVYIFLIAAVAYIVLQILKRFA